MAAGMIQETGQDGGLQTCTPYKRPSLIQALFGRMSTEVDVGGIVQSSYRLPENINDGFKRGMFLVNLLNTQTQ